MSLRISDYDPAAPLDGTELMEVVQGIINYRVTAQDVANLAPGSSAFATIAQVRAGTAANVIIAPDTLHDAAAPQVLVDDANVAWDMSLGFNAKVTLGGNHNINAPTNPEVGLSYVLEVIQDGTGNRVPVLNAAFDFGSVGAPTFSTAAGKRDILFMYCYDAVTPRFRTIFSKSA